MYFSILYKLIFPKSIKIAYDSVYGMVQGTLHIIFVEQVVWYVEWKNPARHLHQTAVDFEIRQMTDKFRIQYPLTGNINMYIVNYAFI